ncbi:MAG: hypothetical protein ABSB49_17385 [Polyangia bacterium]
MASNPTHLTRRQVAALLGVAETEVKSRDNATFHPMKAADGSWRYPPEEVAAVLRGLVTEDSTAEPSGALCAKAFGHFRGGKSLVDVVVELQATPAIVRSLRAEFDSMTSCLTFGSTTLHALGNLLGSVPKDEATTIALVTALVEKVTHEYRRGYADGLAEANDLGEIVDPSTGKRRPIASHEVAAAMQTVDDRWREHDSANAAPSHSDGADKG